MKPLVEMKLFLFEEFSEAFLGRILFIYLFFFFATLDGTCVKKKSDFFPKKTTASKSFHGRGSNKLNLLFKSQIVCFLSGDSEEMNLVVDV